MDFLFPSPQPCLTGVNPPLSTQALFDAINKLRFYYVQYSFCRNKNLCLKFLRNDFFSLRQLQMREKEDINVGLMVVARDNVMVFKGLFQDGIGSLYFLCELNFYRLTCKSLQKNCIF